MIHGLACGLGLTSDNFAAEVCLRNNGKLSQLIPNPSVAHDHGIWTMDKVNFEAPALFLKRAQAHRERATGDCVQKRKRERQSQLFCHSHPHKIDAMCHLTAMEGRGAERSFCIRVGPFVFESMGK